jgi:hypothetical protein
MSIYLDMPADSYHAMGSIGSTTAKLWLESPRLFKDHVVGIHKRKDSDAMSFGRAAHMRFTEADKFASLAKLGPVNEKTGRPYGKDTLAFAAWEAINPGAIMVGPDDMQRLTYMAGRMPDQVREILRAPGIAESSYFVDIHGIKAKCRPDWIKDGIVYDIKTIGNIDDYEKHISKYKYWFSHAWYRAVIKQETGASMPFKFIFAETAPPFRWRIVPIDADWIGYADAKVESVMREIAAAEISGDFADRGEVEVIASRPAWDSDDDETDEWGD